MLKNENQKLRNENENLMKKLVKLNLIRDTENKNIEEKYDKLNEEQKKIIDNLKSTLNSNITDPKNLLDGEKLIAINFISIDQRINHYVICNNKTKFHEVESQLYEKYPEYTGSENFFVFNGIKIDRWKTLEENSIHGYTIMLKKIED